MTHALYRSPLAERYASKAMLELFSSQTRHGLWRRLWLALAEGERSLGVAIPEQAIAEMRAVKRALDPNLLLNPGNIFEG